MRQRTVYKLISYLFYPFFILCIGTKVQAVPVTVSTCHFAKEKHNNATNAQPLVTWRIYPANVRGVQLKIWGPENNAPIALSKYQIKFSKASGNKITPELWKIDQAINGTITKPRLGRGPCLVPGPWKFTNLNKFDQGWLWTMQTTENFMGMTKTVSVQLACTIEEINITQANLDKALQEPTAPQTPATTTTTTPAADATCSLAEVADIVEPADKANETKTTKPEGGEETKTQKPEDIAVTIHSQPTQNTGAQAADSYKSRDFMCFEQQMGQTRFMWTIRPNPSGGHIILSDAPLVGQPELGNMPNAQGGREWYVSKIQFAYTPDSQGEGGFNAERDTNADMTLTWKPNAGSSSSDLGAAGWTLTHSKVGIISSGYCKEFLANPKKEYKYRQTFEH